MPGGKEGFVVYRPISRRTRAAWAWREMLPACTVPSLWLGGRHLTHHHMQKAPEILQKGQQTGQALNREVGIWLHPVDPFLRQCSVCHSACKVGFIVEPPGGSGAWVHMCSPVLTRVQSQVSTRCNKPEWRLALAKGAHSSLVLWNPGNEGRPQPWGPPGYGSPETT